MQTYEDKEKGLLVVQTDDDLIRCGRMKYDGKRGHYRSDCALTLNEFCTFPTKAEATKVARHIGYPVNQVERVGSRFWSCWGIRHDYRDTYFLAVYE